MNLAQDVAEVGVRRPGLRTVWVNVGGSAIASRIFIIVALMVGGAVMAPGFSSASNIWNLLAVSSILAIATFAQTIVVISGGQGVDLSIGPVMTLAALLVAGLGGGIDAHLPLAFLGVLVMCLIVGTINFIGIYYVGIYPLIMTLGMGFAVSGAVQVYAQAEGSSIPASLILALGGGKLGPVPWLVIVAGLGFVLLLALMRSRIFGRRLYLVGTNPRAARLSGIPVARMYLATYLIASILAGVAGILLLGYAGSTNLTLGDSYTLLSVAAAVIGGTSLAGGKGRMLGSLLGAIIFTVLTNLLVVLGLSPALQELASGMVLIVILGITAREARA